MEAYSPEVLVLYASQTGNCEAISEDLHSQLVEKLPKARRFVLEDHSKKFNLQDKNALKLCVFVVSSTGNGDFPDNGEAFSKYLRSALTAIDGVTFENAKVSPLSHVFYTILGLGDSNYSKYQGAPRFLDDALNRLGATTFYKRGEADEATSLELVVEPWVESAIPAIVSQYKKLSIMSPSSVAELLTPVTLAVRTTETKQEVLHLTTWATLSASKLILDDAGKQVYEITLVTEKDISRDLIEVGSSFSLYPQNSDKDVDFILTQMSWDPKTFIGNKTVRDILQHDVDIVSERLKLSKFHSEYDMKFLPEDLKNAEHLTFKDYAAHPGRCENVPFSILEDDLPKIKPRHFSISNDPFKGPSEHTSKHFRVCFTVHKFKTVSETREGFCTSFLRDMKIGQRVKVTLSRSNRVISLEDQQWASQGLPMVMIAHGTGVAPFVSILHRLRNLPATNPGPVRLFLGMRDDDKAFIYKQEILEAAQALGIKVYLAASRTLSGFLTGVTTIQGYVQDFFRDEQICEDLRAHTGSIKICGNKNTLGKDVISALETVFSPDQVKEMRDSGRLQCELWHE